MTDELKPCPFCGRNPISNEDGFVKCSYGGCGFEESLFYKNWNARPLEDALQKRIAELEAQLAQVAKENDWMKYPEPPESGAK